MADYQGVDAVSISRGANVRQLSLFEDTPKVQTVKYGNGTRVVRSTFVCKMCSGTFPKVGLRSTLCTECSERVPCEVDGCDNLREGHQKLCGSHRWRLRQYGSLEPREQPNCRLSHCENVSTCKDLCSRHYDRFRNGTPDWDRPLGICATSECESKVSNKHRYCDACKQQRARVVGRRLYRETPEHEAERRKAYYGKNAVRIKRINREWHANNPGYSTVKYRRWRKQNPMGARAIDSKKSAKRRKQIEATSIEKISIQAIIDEHGMVCHICNGGIADMSDLHIDHVIPLSRGGAHTKENLKPSHSVCNLRKSDKLMTEL
ncbi:HNH endonuclease signature motif containing protein [Nocardia sp. NPDC056611]|uniref:HNH endonuclease signature motif containing protein n=1 Tax=Nocardia sp. NPDC056611 TaxID=3345877 RepID=UPI00366B6D57